jgi:hypothetical protein
MLLWGAPVTTLFLTVYINTVHIDASCPYHLLVYPFDTQTVKPGDALKHSNFFGYP